MSPSVPLSLPEPATGAALLADSLVGHGVETVFGVPGDTGIVLYDELARRADRLRHVLARDERHAAYMADGYARSSQRLGVCEASSGAGAVYLASGLGEAHASGIPVLVVTTDINRGSRGSGAITEIDQEALFGAVCKDVLSPTCAAEVPDAVARAIRSALSGRPGPTAVILSEDLLEQRADVAPSAGSCVLPGARPAADPTVVRDAAAVLAAAERPVVLAGGGVHASSAWPQLRALAEHAGLPVATTIHGKGALDELHPLSLGVAGGNGCRGYANDFLTDADAYLVLGTRANSTDTNGYSVLPRDAGTVVQVDLDPARAGRNFPAAVPLVGDLATVLEQLYAAWPAAAASRREAVAARIAAARETWRTRQGPAPVADRDDAGLVHPRALVELLHRQLGPRAWVVADPGTPTPNLAAYWETLGQAWRVVVPRGHGPMGYAISSAIGVAVAHPGERVLCLTTESSLAMGAGDLETAARLGLPITYVVVDNVSMAWIKMLQHLYLEQRYFGTEPGPIDCAAISRGFGVPAETARDLDHLARLVQESLRADGPATVVVRVPEHQDAPPPVAPWQSALSGEDAGRPVY